MKLPEGLYIPRFVERQPWDYNPRIDPLKPPLRR